MSSNYIQRRYSRLIFSVIVLIMLVGVLSILSISVGSAFINLPESLKALVDSDNVDVYTRIIIWEIRVPRTLSAIFIGMLMALAGLFMQTVTLNPLADPYLTGMASGALLGVSITIVLSPLIVSPYVIVISAFFGALCAMILTLLIASKFRLDPIGLILGGVAVSMIFYSFSAILQFIGGEKMVMIIIWSLGSLSTASWSRTWFTGITAIILIPLSIIMYKSLNALLLGDENAQSIGVSPKLTRSFSLLISSIATAISVSMFGVIGFVGLVAPHLARLALRSGDHLIVIPVTCLVGSAIMLLSDVIARIIGSPGEFPLTPIMSLIGAPLLIYLMSRRFKNG
ncbi:MAG: FecCD family ABC transporter permease [Thermoprotei archaeon]